MTLFQVDGLALLLVSLTSLVVAASAFYGFHYFRETGESPRRVRLLWPLLAMLWLALCALWTSRQLLVMYAALEVVALCAVALMYLPDTDKARKAGKYYLLCTLSGSVALLSGMAVLYLHYGSLDFDILSIKDTGGSWDSLALALISAGLLLKLAIFPMHGWLPPAHGAAWVPVSAVHASLVVKAAFFVAVRFWDMLAPDAVAAAQFLGMLGAMALFWGGMMAWRQTELKGVVAYSTVSQLGYLLFLFPLVTATSDQVTQLAWEGTWLFVISHALAKAAMFMAAGNLMLSMGRHDLAGLSGVGRYLPLSLLIFGLAAVSLMGLPPSGGFLAKWLLLHAAVLDGQWQWVAVLSLGTLLGAAYVFRIFRCCFVEEEMPETVRRLPLSLDLVALVLALAAVSLGLFAEWPLALLRQGGEG